MKNIAKPENWAVFENVNGKIIGHIPKRDKSSAIYLRIVVSFVELVRYGHIGFCIPPNNWIIWVKNILQHGRGIPKHFCFSVR